MKTDLWTPICHKIGIPIWRKPIGKIIKDANGASNPICAEIIVHNKLDKDLLMTYLFDVGDDNCLSYQGYDLFEAMGGNTDVEVEWNVIIKKQTVRVYSPLANLQQRAHVRSHLTNKF